MSKRQALDQSGEKKEILGSSEKGDGDKAENSDKSEKLQNGDDTHLSNKMKSDKRVAQEVALDW